MPPSLQEVPGFSSENFLLYLQMVILSMFSHGLLSVHVFVLITSSYKDISHTGLGPQFVDLI